MRQRDTGHNVGKAGEKPLDCRVTGPGMPADPQTRSILDRLLGLRREEDARGLQILRCGPFLQGRDRGRELDD